MDSAEYPALTNAPGRLLELARGASNNIDMLENSYAANSTSEPSHEAGNIAQAANSLT